MLFIIFLVFSTLFSFILAQQGVLIGDLVTKDHDVEGTVYAIDSRTLRIDNFRYDGEGPAAVYWVDVTNAATSNGKIAPEKDSCEIIQRLPAFTGTQSVTIELPNDYTLSDIGYFSIWCEEFTAEFGGIQIDADSISNVPNAPSAKCSQSTSEDTTMAATFPVQNGWNCEPLTDSFQVRWVINEQNLNVELVATNSGTERYMSFGVSGSDSKTEMIGSDVVVAYTDGKEFKAVDYYMSTRSPCTSGSGVCPDTLISPTPGKNDITNVSGDLKKGITMVRYTRPLVASDKETDLSISSNGPTFVSWALGPLDEESNLPRFHAGEMNFPRSEDVSIEFGRTAKNNCPNNLDSSDSTNGNSQRLPGFVRPFLSGVTNITARIGPSGGARGVEALINATSWGIAWYLWEAGTTGEDVLIPALGVERGKTYTFTVHGGVKTDSTFHPFYITSDSRGGFSQKSPAERSQEKVYAGIEVLERDENNGITKFNAPAQGALCRITSSATDTSELRKWEDFAETLDFSCENNNTISENAGKLQWTVPMDAPDELFYQCVTHETLGYKILVFDEGKIDEDKLKEANGGDVLLQSDGEEENDSKVFKVNFGGEEKVFNGRTKLEQGIEIFWNLNKDKGEIETLFRAPNVGYLGLGWGYEKMIGSNAVVVFDSNGGPKIDDYELTQQSTRGVQPATNQKLISSAAEKDGDFLVGLFTRPLEVEGLPSIVNGEISAIWAVGPKPGSGTTLETHNVRGISVVDLASGVASDSNSEKALFQAHGALMGIAWLLLTPSAILAMGYFKKWNPTPFLIHRGLNMLSVLLTIIAFIIAVVKGSHTKLAHLGIGVVVTILALVQAALGIFRPDHEASSRRFWCFLHVAFGVIALGLSHANIFLGIVAFDDIFQLPSPRALWFALAGAAVGVYVLLHIVFSIKPGRTSPSAPRSTNSSS